ncbi:glycoside hydrolase family 28 protein [Siphonobacter sp. SORGH_AS_0500]|uniref:glycoside hydrolase family 28 protein n=1 Tax=Siphonobacter sp. SORGH_AS_0500 TaxID=1864824 RepID=UPI00286277BE|nr:glycoside hydrolase family 28 protein [Siphonobacter sp. SORGH_AS_0500]MDR6193467.1 polygalacturonase [Siphonobacter sp. SORGH_AS_0500]
MNNRNSLIALFPTLIISSLLGVLLACRPQDQPHPTNPSVTLQLLADGVTDQAKPLQRAIDSCGATGGGTLILPAGKYLISPIILRSRVTLQLESGATLLASTNAADYTSKLPNLINGDSLTDVSLKGQGTIDGNGAIWWQRFRDSGKTLSRPRLIYITRSTNLLIDGLTLINSPSFHLVASQCRYVTIQNLTITAPPDSPNTDGIDPANCTHVLIQHCTIDNGDDNIAIKGGRSNGQIIQPCQDIQIRNCQFLHGHGLSIGSETSSGVTGVSVTNCTFNGTTNGIRIKSQSGLGGSIQNLSYKQITMTDVPSPLIIDLAYSLNSNNGYPNDIPSVSGLTIDQLTVTGAKNAGSLVGLTNSLLQNLTLSNLHINARTGLVLQNARNVAMNAYHIEVSSGPSVIAQNATGTGF